MDKGLSFKHMRVSATPGTNSGKQFPDAQHVNNVNPGLINPCLLTWEYPWF